MAKQAKKRPLSKDTLVLNSLQTHEFRWIGNVPLNKIVEMRERGELQDMRELLSRSITEIETATDDEFVEVGRQVEYNLEQAFKKHRNEIQELSESYKNKYKIDVVSVAVTGTLGLISAMYPPLAQIIGFLSSSLAETVSVSKLIRDFFEERKSLRALQRKPVGMLFEAKEMKS
jgi:stress-induced morphogen